jgi:hypothetical protein
MKTNIRGMSIPELIIFKIETRLGKTSFFDHSEEEVEEELQYKLELEREAEKWSLRNVRPGLR